MEINVKKYLNDNIDLKYREFSLGLLPTDTNILGVRMPILRRLSKQIAVTDYKTYLQNACSDTHEEIMLQGMVIGNIDVSFDELTNYIENFIPKINNWSICDSFVASLRLTKKYKSDMFEYIKKYINSSEYSIRFMLVMFIWYYADLEYLNEIFSIIDKIESDKYYVKMAIAWLLSSLFIKYEDYTLDYLKKTKIDNFTYNKTIQKIIESKQINEEKKEHLKKMKRV